MKKSGLLCVFIFAIQFAKSQNDKVPFELGLTPVTLNSIGDKTEYQKKPPYEIFNAIFFRYHFDRWAIRFLSSFSENSYNNIPPPEVKDGATDIGKNKDFRIGIGAQYNLIKTKKWLYLFADVLYRTVHSTGTFSGESNGFRPINYVAVGNGIDSFVGVGAQLKIYKSLYFSPELAFNISMLGIKRTDDDPMRGTTTNTFYVTNVNADHVIKLHLSIRF